MNGVLLGIAYVAAVNPLRTRLGLPEHEGGRARMGVLARYRQMLWIGSGWSGGVP